MVVFSMDVRKMQMKLAYSNEARFTVLQDKKCEEKLRALQYCSLMGLGQACWQASPSMNNLQKCMPFASLARQV